MKLNWAERWVVNNPIRVIEQWMEIHFLKGMISFKEGMKILEVGCGRGAGARLIHQTFRPSLLCALDLDIDMVRKANGYLAPDEREKTLLHVGDVFRLPFRDGAFDVVFGFGVLHHVLDWRGAVGEIARVLKIGGTYVLEELYPSVYQNFITKHILVHPSEDRFLSHDLREGLESKGLPIRDAIELKKIGILGVSVKDAGAKAGPTLI
jgi:ubiquinone/menaquinone biosynthesis C-methylase UbiE